MKQTENTKVLYLTIQDKIRDHKDCDQPNRTHFSKQIYHLFLGSDVVLYINLDGDINVMKSKYGKAKYLRKYMESEGIIERLQTQIDVVDEDLSDEEQILLEISVKDAKNIMFMLKDL